jgi:carboxypeptidase Taq
MSAYAELKRRRATIYNLEHLQGIATWDRMVNMPSRGSEVRAAAQGELEVLIQGLQTDPAIGDLLSAAGDERLEADDEANLGLMVREQKVARALPEALVRRRSELVGAASQAWGKAKAENDWPSFAEAFAPLVDCLRERADRLGEAMELAPYDALLDEHDRGLTLAAVQALFDPVRAWLPDLIRTVVARQARETVLQTQGPFPVEGQRRVGVAIMSLLGFDFDAGRLDVSAHPFMIGIPGDVRITTRYRESECFQSLVGIVHETGHALYQSNLPPAWRGQPLGEPASAAIHESQSLTFERQVAPSRAFAAQIAPILRAEFGDQPAFDPDNLFRLMTRVRPGAIRVEADEVTYPAHILLRTEIEPMILSGELPVADIPAWWGDRMQALLDIDVRGDDTRGALQDIQWSQGMFGYFPSYLQGAMIAAQLGAAFRQAHPDFPEQAARGAFGGLKTWLGDNVWRHGSRLTTDEIVRRATGRPLSADALKAHFESRYLEVAP